MQIRFYGAVRTTTGSMHLLVANGKRVLLDCGLYQGRRKEAFERNRNFPFEPKSIDAVVLSHAHIDHSGNLPTLAKRGFRGSVHTMPATADLCDVMLQDSARLQVQDVEYVNKDRRREGRRPFEPLYVPEDVERLLKRLSPLGYGEPREIVPGVTITFHDAGHILGSALTEIHLRENGSSASILFTGDLGRKGMPILRDPEIVKGTDTLITESTYGARVHDTKDIVSDHLRRLIAEVEKRRSRLIIPAFSVGRTQQILYYLDELYEKRQVPDVPVCVDSPLSTKVTGIYSRHTDCYDAEALGRLMSGGSPFAFPRLRFITEVEESKALNAKGGPVVIIAPSGMCEGGRILHHLKHGVGARDNIVLFVGYQADSTLGRYLVEGRKTVRILGRELSVEARIDRIDALSAHADSNELAEYFSAIASSTRRAFVVHGELDGAEALASRLRTIGIANVEVPSPGEAVTL